MDSWPTLVNGNHCIEKYMHQDHSRCVFVVERSDGTFSLCGFEQVEGWDEKLVWTPYGDDYSIYEEKATLLKDMNLMYPWTKNVKPSYNT